LESVGCFWVLTSLAVCFLRLDMDSLVQGGMFCAFCYTNWGHFLDVFVMVYIRCLLGVKKIHVRDVAFYKYPFTGTKNHRTQNLVEVEGLLRDQNAPNSGTAAMSRRNAERTFIRKGSFIERRDDFSNIRRRSEVVSYKHRFPCGYCQ